MSVAVRVIPCLDVDAGRVVKGVNFVGLRDAGDPVELARRYDEQGADELTFLDITASSGERETTYEVVRRTAEQVFIPLTVGGGVRTVADVDALLRAGADKVGVNTAAIARPELLTEIAERFGRQVLVLSVDARRAETPSGFEVTTHGGRRGTGIDAVAWAQQAAELGAGEILLNSMDADGTKDGYDLPLDPAGARCRDGAGDRERGSGQGRRLRPGSAGRRRRGARRERVPLRRPDHRRGQGLAASGRARGSVVRNRTNAATAQAASSATVELSRIRGSSTSPNDPPTSTLTSSAVLLNAPIRLKTRPRNSPGVAVWSSVMKATKPATPGTPTATSRMK